jgi:hypothetical protein
MDIKVFNRLPDLSGSMAGYNQDVAHAGHLEKVEHPLDGSACSQRQNRFEAPHALRKPCSQHDG